MRRANRGLDAAPRRILSAAVPLIETPENIQAAAVATRELNAPFLTVVLEGKYTGAYLKRSGKDAPKFTSEDLKVIAEPVDFVGINQYRASYYVLRSDKAPGYREAPFSKSHPKMFGAWLTFCPETLYWGPKLVQSLWNAKAIYITENGCAAADELVKDGNVYDTDRVMYLRTVSCISSERPRTAFR